MIIKEYSGYLDILDGEEEQQNQPAESKIKMKPRKKTTAVKNNNGNIKKKNS